VTAFDRAANTTGAVSALPRLMHPRAAADDIVAVAAISNRLGLQVGAAGHCVADRRPDAALHLGGNDGYAAVLAVAVIRFGRIVDQRHRQSRP